MIAPDPHLSDPGVQAIAALCEPPLDAVLRIAALLEARDRKRPNS